MAARLGLEGVHAQRGWDYLRRLEWRPQMPRPRHPAAADPAAQAAFPKT